VSEPPPEFDVRASDVERNLIAEVLQGHHTTGRLTLTELDERTAAAYAAVTRDQLTALLADLPADPTDRSMTEAEPTSGGIDPCLLWMLVCLYPMAGLMYWLYARSATEGVDPLLLVVLVCLCPPAGLVYWLYFRRAR
jgi:hypothetical protein